jgi:predicted RNA binding protein YcfA (HicA-like mRNA interferase family)
VGANQRSAAASQHVRRAVLNQKRAIRLLEKNGWNRETGGKHSVKMSKPGRRPIPLPHHGGSDYSRWLTAKILKEAGLD